LAYEGNLTEADYFEKLKESARFNDEQIHLLSLKRKKGDTNSAPNHVFKKLKNEAKEEFNFKSPDELWMIIDRDEWKGIDKISELCKEEGNFFLALSNPCFEFWLLLHIKDITDYSHEELNVIFENKKVNNTKTHLKQLLGTLLDEGYNESRPRSQRFFSNIDLAISRAKSLDNLNEDYPSYLGSHVYKLVERIIK
jgi:hypothetical protein